MEDTTKPIATMLTTQLSNDTTSASVAVPPSTLEGASSLLTAVYEAAFIARAPTHPRGADVRTRL